MKWRQAKKLIKLDGKGKGRLRRWSAYHRICNRHWKKWDDYINRHYKLSSNNYIS